MQRKVANVCQKSECKTVRVYGSSSRQVCENVTVSRTCNRQKYNVFAPKTCTKNECKQVPRKETKCRQVCTQQKTAGSTSVPPPSSPSYMPCAWRILSLRTSYAVPPPPSSYQQPQNKSCRQEPYQTKSYKNKCWSKKYECGTNQRKSAQVPYSCPATDRRCTIES